jgi:hypothetical protein
LFIIRLAKMIFVEISSYFAGSQISQLEEVLFLAPSISPGIFPRPRPEGPAWATHRIAIWSTISTMIGKSSAPSDPNTRFIHNEPPPRPIFSSAPLLLII